MGWAHSLYANNAAGRPIGQVNIGGEQNAVGPSPRSLNAWTHLAVMYYQAALTLYVNGEPVATRSRAGRSR